MSVLNKETYTVAREKKIEKELVSTEAHFQQFEKKDSNLFLNIQKSI